MVVVAAPANNNLQSTKTHSAGCLSDEEKKILERIFAFSIDDESARSPLSKALASEMEWSKEFTEQAIVEYKKFTFLSSRFPGEMVPSVIVDSVWHMHILYTRSYQSYCREALSVDFLHHDPAKGNEDEERSFHRMYLNTIIKYQQIFGEPPETIWGGNAAKIALKFGLQDSITS